MAKKIVVIALYSNPNNGIPRISWWETCCNNNFVIIQRKSSQNKRRKLQSFCDDKKLCATYWGILVDFDQRYSAYPTPTYPSDSVSVAKTSKDVTGKTKSARNFIIH